VKMKSGWKLYLDTSVFGGCFDEDEGWVEDSRRVLGYCETGKAVLIRTPLLEEELEAAPYEVTDLLHHIPAQYQVRTSITQETIELAEAYLEAKVVSRKSLEDCLHVAAATLAHADAIVSWNFKHIVRLDRIKAFNAVNLMHGYGMITILSPMDVHLEDSDHE
jgi:predicted nucleic acid-binding protein